MNAIMVYTQITYYHAGDVSLGMILSFFSGADDIPPMGYAHAPEIILITVLHTLLPLLVHCS